MFLIVPLAYKIVYGVGFGLSVLWSVSVSLLTRKD